MKRQEFINEFKEQLEIEDLEVKLETELDSIQEWDSMGVMITIGIVSDNFQVTISGAEMKALTTVQSLIDKIGSDKFTD